MAEDGPVSRELARALLTGLGAEVEVAEDGVVALAALERRAFDLVLMDCLMPRLDGFTATEELRRREQADAARPRTRVVAVSADASPGHRARCVEAGMDGCLVKPLAPGEIGALLGVRPPISPSAVAPGTRAASSPVDESVLESLRALERSGAPAFVDRVVAAYLDHGPSQLAAAREALASGHAEALRRAVHTLKSSSANVGAWRLSGMCRELEEESRSGVPGSASVRLEQIGLELSNVGRVLRERTGRVLA